MDRPVPPPGLSLRDPRFVRFFTGQAVGEGGYAVYAIAVVWIAYNLTGSVAAAAAVLAIEFGVYTFAFLVGPLVDRAADLRRLLVLGYVSQAGLAGLLGALTVSGRLSFPVLLAFVVALSAVWDVTWTSVNAALPRLVGRDRLFRASGLLGAVNGGNQIVGFGVGGALLLLVGPGDAMLLYGVLNVAAAAILAPLAFPSAQAAVERSSASMAEGWRYLFAGEGRPRLQVAGFYGLQALFSGAPVLFITASAATAGFAHPAQAYAVMYTALGTGLVVGGLVLARINPRGRLGAVLAVTTIAEGGLIVGALLLGPDLLLAAPAWFAVGLVDDAFYATVMVFFQATTLEPLVGRTLANAYLFRGSSRITGLAILGAFIGSASLLALGGIVGATFVVIGVGGVVALPAVRRLRF